MYSDQFSLIFLVPKQIKTREKRECVEKVKRRNFELRRLCDVCDHLPVPVSLCSFFFDDSFQFV